MSGTLRERPPIYLFDDAQARDFQPFALTRPLGTLVTGSIPIWARWQVALQSPVAGFLAAAHLTHFEEVESPTVHQGRLPRGAIVANARFAPAGEVIPWRSVGPDGRRRGLRSADANAEVWTADGRVVAIRLDREMDASAFADGLITLESLAEGRGSALIEGWWHENVWDFIRLLPAVMTDDITRSLDTGGTEPAMETVPIPPHVTVLGDHPVIAHADAKHSADTVIEPHVVLDATAGPIYIAAGVHVRAFTRITGPCYIGRGSTIMGSDVSGCSIGPMCKVRGEISSTIVLGYSNKGHEGFVGHSYLGRWVNLGAGTTTSNLKNTYGTVGFWTPSGVRDSGMQFLGTMFGDHAKTGIGLQLTTGTMFGAGANAYGTMPPKAVPPFAWGDGAPYSEYRMDKFLESADRMMQRRHVPLTLGARRQLEAAFASRYAVGEDGGG